MPSSPSFDLSPVLLSYTAALRGVLPRAIGQSFQYVQVGSLDPEQLICLAASNPDGQFYGLIPDAIQLQQAQNQAKDRSVSNVRFISSTESLPAQIHYLCCDTSGEDSSKDPSNVLVALAESRVVPGGLIAYRYQAYANPDESLRFLISEYASEFSTAQAQEFLAELRKLGALYFAEHPIAKAALDKAISSNSPDEFFSYCQGPTPATSKTFETMEALLTRGYAFAGDAKIGSNYMELATPPESHETLIKCRDHLLYEPIKDFAAQRQIRNDVWVRLPAEQSYDKPTLFGLFAFGVTTPREKIPTSVPTKGGSVDLSSPLFTKILDLMTVLPLGVGDFLQHESGQGFEPDDVLAAIQVLVAAGIAQPVRARYEGQVNPRENNPVFATSFNAFLRETTIREPSVRVASTIVGAGLTLSAREALVLQAIARVGISNSAGALQPELQRLATQNPSLAAQIMDSPEPTDEVINTIVTKTLQNGMVRWYAYGLLAA